MLIGILTPWYCNIMVSQWYWFIDILYTIVIHTNLPYYEKNMTIYSLMVYYILLKTPITITIISRFVSLKYHGDYLMVSYY